MMRRRAVSTARRPFAWFVVAAGLVLYGVAVVVLTFARVSPTLLLPWWLAQAAPPIVYAVLIRACVRPVSVSRWVAATGLLWAVHVLLGVLTAGVVASLGAWSVDFSVVEAFPPPLIPELLWVPLLLLPLRDPIAGHRRALRARWTQDRGLDGGPRDGSGAPTPVRQARITPTVPVAPTPASVVPFAAPASEHSRSDVKWPQRAPRDTDSRPHAPSQPEPVGARAAAPQPPSQAPTAITPAKRLAEAPPPRLDETAGQETLAAPMRVSFDRLAGQFPAGAFQIPLDQIGANLQEPGYLSIPSRLVLEQLGEGLVRAGWDVVAPQIPERLLALTSEEIALRLTDGQLVLPLDELVPQVPLDLLLSTARPVDVDGIERFPAPFQPTEAFEAPAPEDQEPAAEWPESGAEWPLVEGAGTGREATDLPTLEDVEPAPILTGLIEVDPESTPLTEVQSATTLHDEAMDDPGHSGPPPPDEILEVAASSELSSRSVAPPEFAPMHPETANESSAVELPAATLNTLDVVVASADGVKILASSSSSLGVGAAVAATKLLVPVLGAARGPWTINQVTLRSRDGALILTPLGLVDGAGSVLVSAVPPGGSLALAEIASLRAAANCTPDVVGRQRDEAPNEPRDADLLDTEPPSLVHRTAATLDAMGPVVPTMFRVAETERDLYLFLPPGSDVRTVARVAREIDQTMRAVARLGPVFHTAVLRCGTRRLIIRMDGVDADGSSRSIIIVGGETGRPGLACRQAEDAALALGVR